MIALERDGAPLLGSIYFPIQDHHLIGSAETGTFLNGARCRVSKPRDSLSDPPAHRSSRLDPRRERERVARLCGGVRLVRGLGDCYGYYLVARGLADVMINPPR